MEGPIAVRPVQSITRSNYLKAQVYVSSDSSSKPIAGNGQHLPEKMDASAFWLGAQSFNLTHIAT